MNMADLATFIGASSPIWVVFFTWITRRGLDRKAAETAAVEARITAQREDFKAVLEPVQKELDNVRTANAALQTRTTELENRLERAETDTHAVLYALNRVRDYLVDRYQDTGPRLGARVETLIATGGVE